MNLITNFLKYMLDIKYLFRDNNLELISYIHLDN